MNQAINEIIQLSRLLEYETKTTQEKQNHNCVEKDTLQNGSSTVQYLMDR